MGRTFQAEIYAFDSKGFSMRDIARAIVSIGCTVSIISALSCSKMNGGSLARSVVRAHGGKSAVERLQSYAGKGFIKDPSDTVIAKSNPFDMFRSGVRYKHRLIRMKDGRVGDAIVLSYDGEKTYEWTGRTGLRSTQPMDLALLRYRFPVVLSWLIEKSNTLQVLPVSKADREVHAQFTEEALLVELSFDMQRKLLLGVRIGSLSDSTYVFEERYSNYTDLDGIPFPGRFRAYYRGMPVYDYVLSKVELQPTLPDSIFTVLRSDTTFGR